MRIRPAVAILAALALGTGCSSAAGQARSDQVGIVVAATGLNFGKEVSMGFQAGVSAVSSVPAFVTGPPSVDGAKQVQLFTRFAATDPGGISVFTLTPELFISPLAAVRKQGIPLIAVDNPPLPGSGIPLFVGNDNRQLGTMLADQVIAKLGPEAAGDIVLGNNSPGTPVLDQRAEGLIAEFARKLPGVRVLGPFDTKQETAANLTAWRVLVSANPKALAFVGTGDADGWNLATVREETHADWVAGAYDLDPRSMQAVKDGQLLLVSPEHYIAGAVAGQLQARAAQNGDAPPTGWLATPGLDVTPANVEAVIQRQSSAAARRTWFAAEVNRIVDHTDSPLRPLSETD